ncbi:MULTISPECIES: hypothetical protein [Amycolatopsis]|uniref:Uncharacterized protein n=1 Tax=Amycolatopsis echigonensis TaxID=2576905 RepID=A0A2N3WNT7_9PSEU|nr:MULTISPECIES: hypothetical protein [Amycolatopsis]PKV95525.1 hypothetical protein ATK30_6447 [Amycolatopsis niigatensis]
MTNGDKPTQTNRARETAAPILVRERDCTAEGEAKFLKILGRARVYNEATTDGILVLDLAELARSRHLLACWADLRLRELPSYSTGRLPVSLPAQDMLAELFGRNRNRLLAELKAA